jgi:DNA-binding response OmpR family regulator
MTYILAVDDDLEVLETLGRVLRREAFEVALVSSGAEALTVLDKREPDLMILDIIMPGMDGISVCKRLRQDARFAALPILFLTAKGTTDDIVDGLDAGADDYVVKPFELAELRARIQLIQLTSTEHRLLRYLMENPNRALSPGHLLQAVWEYPPNTGDPDLVRAHVRNLRAKIEREPARKYIRTIHGVGYMIST